MSEEVDEAKQREGAAMIEAGLALMREADPGASHGVLLAWAVVFGSATIEDGEDLSGVHVMLPVEGVSWPLLLGIMRGGALKVERSWLNQISD